jgi:hypothetical protein
MTRTKLVKLRVNRGKARQVFSSANGMGVIEIEALVVQSSESPAQSLKFQHGSRRWLDRSPIKLISMDVLGDDHRSEHVPSHIRALFRTFCPRSRSSTRKSLPSLSFRAWWRPSLFTLREQLQAAFYKILCMIERNLSDCSIF